MEKKNGSRKKKFSVWVTASHLAALKKLSKQALLKMTQALFHSLVCSLANLIESNKSEEEVFSSRLRSLLVVGRRVCAIRPRNRRSGRAEGGVTFSWVEWQHHLVSRLWSFSFPSSLLSNRSIFPIWRVRILFPDATPDADAATTAPLSIPIRRLSLSLSLFLPLESFVHIFNRLSKGVPSFLIFSSFVPLIVVQLVFGPFCNDPTISTWSSLLVVDIPIHPHTPLDPFTLRLYHQRHLFACSVGALLCLSFFLSLPRRDRLFFHCSVDRQEAQNGGYPAVLDRHFTLRSQRAKTLTWAGLIKRRRRASRWCWRQTSGPNSPTRRGKVEISMSTSSRNSSRNLWSGKTKGAKVVDLF